MGKSLKEERGMKILERKSRLDKNWVGEEYQVVGNFIHPCDLDERDEVSCQPLRTLDIFAGAGGLSKGGRIFVHRTFINNWPFIDACQYAFLRLYFSFPEFKTLMSFLHYGLLCLFFYSIFLLGRLTSLSNMTSFENQKCLPKYIDIITI